MMATPVFHGTQFEAEALRNAIARNCTCEMDPETAARSLTCPPHKALLEDQRFIDGLLFYRRIRGCLLREEGIECH